MSNPFRKKQATQSLLDTLELAGSYPLEVSVVRNHLKDMVKPQLSDKEWDELITSALNQDLIVQVPSKLDSELIQYTITERGQSLKRQS